LPSENFILQTPDGFAYPAEVLGEPLTDLYELRVVTVAEINLTGELVVRRQNKKFATHLHTANKVDGYWHLKISLILEL
jgi:hypothetical protein